MRSKPVYEFFNRNPFKGDLILVFNKNDILPHQHLRVKTWARNTAKLHSISVHPKINDWVPLKSKHN